MVIDNGSDKTNYRKSPARSRPAYIRGRLVEWFIYHGFYSENVFQIKGLGGLYMKYSICLSISIYKPLFVNEGGLNMRVAYQMKFFPKK